VYEIFEIKLKPKEIDLRQKLDKINKLNWYSNGGNFVKTDDGLQYILDLSSLTLKCIMGELFPISEGQWLPQEYPSREELVNVAISQLQKLPFDIEIVEIRRVVKHD